VFHILGAILLYLVNKKQPNLVWLNMRQWERPKDTEQINVNILQNVVEWAHQWQAVSARLRKIKQHLPSWQIDHVEYFETSNLNNCNIFAL
jgi:hypothetical protein